MLKDVWMVGLSSIADIISHIALAVADISIQHVLLQL